jgi:hypothetical protein
MRDINKGNVLAFYKSLSHQSEVYYSTPTSQRHFVGGNLSLLPFQLISPSGAFLQFDVFSDTGVFLGTLPVVTRSTNAFQDIYTYSAPANLAYVSDCNYYTVRVKELIFNTYVYFSEKIFVRSNWEFTVSFTNSSDIGNVMYQTGYTQKVYFTPYEDVPLTDITNELEINLSGQEIITSTRQTEKRQVVGVGFLDSQLTALKRIEQHGTIQIIETVPAQTTNVKRLTFEHEATEDKRNLGRFIFEVDVASQTGCGENSFILLP